MKTIIIYAVLIIASIADAAPSRNKRSQNDQIENVTPQQPLMNAQVETSTSTLPSQGDILHQEQSENLDFSSPRSTSLKTLFSEQVLHTSIFQIPTFPGERSVVSSSNDMAREAMA